MCGYIVALGGTCTLYSRQVLYQLGRASRLECVRRGFKSHLRYSSFSLKKAVSEFVLCCVVLCCVVLRCVMPCCDVLCCVLFCVQLCRAMLCCAVCLSIHVYASGTQCITQGLSERDLHSLYIPALGSHPVVSIGITV